MRDRDLGKDMAWTQRATMLQWSVCCGAMMCFVVALSGGCGAVPGVFSLQPTSCLQDDDCATSSKCQLGVCVARGESSLENQDEKAPPEGSQEQLSPELPDGVVEQPEGCEPGKEQVCFKGDPQLRGKGICQEGTQTCQSDGSWGECTGEGTPTEELCNELDDNCDGQIDENIRISCYGGAEGTRNTGECRAGIQRCVGGKLSDCVGQVLPTNEICGDGLDNNCDGQIDEGCTCTPGGTQKCGSQVGECKQGTQTCQSDQTWSPCQNATQPAAEVCDGKDNNCNGLIDDGFDDLDAECTVGVGRCQNKGKRVCSADGKSTECGAKALPGAVELCNGVDDDCDGQIDNVNQTPCSIQGQFGECAKGTAKCEQGKAACVAIQPQAQAELCDGKDNDCDGKVDQDLSRPCYSGPAGTEKYPPCRQGLETCSGGRWGPCNGQITPQPETCDGLDNNCNGQIDDGVTCQCTQGQTRKCGINTGECKEGTQACNNGNWGACNGQIVSQPEICNGKDDDCDGQIDEDLNTSSSRCTVPGKLGECAKGLLLCTKGTLSCTPVKNPTNETCNGVDDDCDGLIDENLVFNPNPCRVSGGIGQCALGQPKCTNGQFACVPNQPSAETCNGLDDNCNGSIDEGNPGAGAPCTVYSQQGPCRTGAWTCSLGALKCKQTHFPQQEKCDNIDNDCSGTVDDNLTCQPGETRCSINQQQTCNSTCNGWLPPQNCPSGACLNNMCTTPGCLCALGSQKCGPNNTILECKKVNLICEWVPTGVCQPPKVCRTGDTPICQQQ